MKVLLTGASGFIGTNIAEAYRLAGHDIVGVDKKPNADVQLDLTQASVDQLASLMSTVDVINHHAAQVDVRTSLRSPSYDAQENIISTIKLLEAARLAQVPRFIFASSGGAIGTSELPPTPYGIAKLTIEKYLHFFSSCFETVVLRYSNVYGPHQSSGIVAAAFKKALQNETLLINGDGTQTRDLVYVEDVVQANLKALTAVSGIYTISTGIPTNLLELVRSINNIVPLQVQHTNPIAGEVHDSCLSPSGPEGWNPSTSLEEGLKKTFAYYQSVY